MTAVSFHVPEDLRWDATSLRQFSENAPYYIPGVRVSSSTGRDLVLSTNGQIDRAQVLADADSLARSIAAELRDAEEVLLEEASFPASGHGDPMVDLLSTGSARQVGVGRFAYSGVLLTLIDRLDRFLGRLAADCHAEPHAYPTTVSADTLMQSGYLKAFPQHALFVAPVGFSVRKLRFVGECTSVSQLDAGPDEPVFGQHDQVLAPTVCYHCFEALRGHTLNGSRCITAVNPCHRHEVIGGDSLSRLHTFRMREVVAFGPGEYVAEVLDNLLRSTHAACVRWNISHRVTTASDAFFAGAPGSKIFFQSAFALKRELRVRTDFDGQWVAVASFNNHQRSLTRAFSIRAGSAEADSGCVGWGYERLAYALMSQLGVDLNAWPAAIRDDLQI